MSTSLNVVSSAAVFCASFRRSAIGLAKARHLARALRAVPPERRGAGACAEQEGLGAADAARRGRSLSLGGGEHVVLGQAAVLAGALDLARVDMMLEHRPADRGRKRRDMVFVTLGGPSGACSVPRKPAILASTAGLVVAGGFGRWSRSGAAAAAASRRSARSARRPRRCRLP